MNLIAFLLRSGRRGAILVAVMGIVTGLAGTAFVALVNEALHSADPKSLLWPFVAVVLARVSSNLLSQWFLVRFAQQQILELCDHLCRCVIETPFRTLERIGPARIMTSLTDDIAVLSAAVMAIPSVVANAAILLGCIIYLAWLSWGASLVLAAFGLLGSFGYKLLMGKAYVWTAKARAERDSLFRHFRSLTEGLKELKINRARRYSFIDEDVVHVADRLRELNVTATQRYLLADGWAQTAFFLMIGLILFVLPGRAGVTIESLTGFAFVALYAMTPIWGFIGAIPAFHRGRAALSRIETLGLSLERGVAAPVSPGEETLAEGASIELEHVVFAYEDPSGGANGFALGPIDLIIDPGDLVFIIGGNGSGKSTLVKLLTGLYLPDSGVIRVDGRAVTPDSVESYRERFSVVFSDFFLFEKLSGRPSPELDAAAHSYLRMLDLDQKVRVEAGVLSTTSLSQGQRRRLALLTAYLEDRPVYVFDEWAADQDPTYRQIFYSRFLPELKARGKTVVVITHDDRYFHLGDRVIRLDYGKIVHVERPAAPVGGRYIDPV